MIEAADATQPKKLTIKAELPRGKKALTMLFKDEFEKEEL
jgi:hypothetical protein